MRIAIVGPLPPPSGGMANQTRQLVQLLEDEGAEVEMVQVNKPYWPGWVRRIWGLRASFRLLPYIAALWRAAGRVQLMHVMANSGWSWYLFATPAVWIAKLRRIPVLINYRGGEAEIFFSCAWTWVRPTLARADAVIVPSGFLETVFARRGITPRIIPNIIDLNRFPLSQRRGIDKIAPHIVVTRNLEPIYDIPTALRAFKEIQRKFPRARLTIAGSGPLRKELERLARDLGLAEAVAFTGRLDNERIAEIYRSADLMLNPSLADNMPISILEALACGVPVVSTRVGGIPFLVEDGRTALLVPPGDSCSMASAAIRMLTEPALAELLRTTGFEVIQQYTWSAVRERLFKIYNELLPNGRTAIETSNAR